MNPYYNYAVRTLRSPDNYRQKVFDEAVKEFHHVQRPEILEIGATRSLSKFARFSDGWSSVFFQTLNPTRHVIVDTSIIAIELTAKLLDIPEHAVSQMRMGADLKYFPTLLADDGLLHIQDTNFDIVYLDGSDSPEEMKDQFDWCDKRTQIIICDDWATKGSLIERVYGHLLPEDYERTFDFKIGNEPVEVRTMALFLPHDSQYPLD